MGNLPKDVYHTALGATQATSVYYLHVSVSLSPSVSV